MSHKSLVSLLVVLMAATAFANLSCLNRQGNPTAWFNAIRYPDSITASGARYAYLDPSAGSSFQVVSGANVDDASEPLAKTIQSINSFSGSNKNLLVYTNTPSNGTLIGTNAHAKAIIAFDTLTQTGIYIMFSFLSYPDVAQDGTINASIPLDGNQYAQMNGPDGNYVYCLSFDSDLLSVLKDFLPNAQPNIVYSSGIFSNMPTNPNFVYEISPFTVPNADFQWFVTKSSTANLNMYDDIIANQFGVNLAVASSQNLTNACTPMIVVNIDSITINSQDTWSSTIDNSKWAVGIIGTLESVYFCDNDRTPEQNNRGGSCIATADRNVYAAYKNIFAYNNTCGNTTMIAEDILA